MRDHFAAFAFIMVSMVCFAGEPKAEDFPLRFWIVTSMQYQRPNILSGGNSVTVTHNKSCSMSISDHKIRYLIRDTATAENRFSWKRCWTGDPGEELMGRRRGDHIELVVPDSNKAKVKKYEILQMSPEN